MAEEKREFTTKLATVNDTYLPLIERQLEGNSITFNEYSKRCVLNSIAAINQMLSNAGIGWNDKSLDQSNITQILLCNVQSIFSFIRIVRGNSGMYYITVNTNG